MKQLKILIVLLCIVINIGMSSAYTESELMKKAALYERILTAKYSERIAQMNTKTLSRLETILEQRLAQIDTQDAHLKKTALYTAFLRLIHNTQEATALFDGMNSEVNLTITIINDKRCKDICNLSSMYQNMKSYPELDNAKIIEKDFSDEGVKIYMIEHNITMLPAMIFSHNDIGDELSPFLTKLHEGEYSMEIGAQFNPFQALSERGYKVLSQSELTEIIGSAHFKGSQSAEISMIEYTDVNCHFCQKMEKDGTSTKIFAAFPGNIRKTSSNFIGVGGNKTQIAAELLECIARDGGADVYSTVLSSILVSGDNSKENILVQASNNNLNRDTIESCHTSGETKSIVASKFSMGTNVFRVTGTPSTIIFNNTTGEYIKVVGAYPADHFIKTVEDLLVP